MIYEINHAGVFVNDAKKTIEFYTKHFQAEVVFEREIPGAVHLAYIQIADGMIEIVEMKNPEKRATARLGYDHLCFMTDNLDEDYGRLIQAGYAIIEEPRPAASGNGRLGFLADPNGLRVELIERDDTFRKPTITTGDVRGFDHISISAQNLEATEQFYAEHVVMKQTYRTHVDHLNLTMIHLKKGDHMLELMHTPNPKSESGSIGHIALRVEHVDLFAAKLEQQGVQLEAGYPKDAVNGFGRTAKLKGPDGELIDLVDDQYIAGGRAI